ncbi:phosphoesterase [Rhodoblastus acidophilus]|uniref:Phosphoesterase n=1 Tax=Candidatus Rhodoblastus alkanivorans TaxID=2954117 RepID=A0ABS9ZA09_9HYPH|nr:alkaline phosphatase family protein [Candidatus Rhodoblastus alkanivorans]MCI4677166.1 phosphoesterase [Candidatus Rhodoblastus alkanivorans]MCI4684519.1 phosphoesterase [Candidatus Rhodoblastus alkanivorans]MDI4641840.1 phosphoesterase [Rhodoblastus acidophilus]
MRDHAFNTTRLKRHLCSFVALGAVMANAMTPSLVFAATAEAIKTRTPIKHVIVIIGENRSFDHIFATYKPVNKNEKVLNLLSEGIVKADGSPGPDYSKAAQEQASDTTTYQNAPTQTGPYAVLPPALTGGPAAPYFCKALGVNATSCVADANIAFAKTIENGLPDNYYKYLLTGGTGQASHVPDARVFYAGKDASHLPNGPYQLTNAKYPYDAYAASPVHRFFQMWQQLDCKADRGHGAKGFGCRNDLYPWVEATVGAGSNGAAQPSGFNDSTTGEGSTSMGFFNVENGDAPYLKKLADDYTMSDNYHQGVAGGTGANHVMLGYADAIWFSDGAGHAAVPPHNTVNPSAPGATGPGGSALSEIENPNPQPGTNNYYIQDGYGGGSGSPTAVSPKASYGGGSYVACADATEPGVGPILNYLGALRRPVPSRCQNGHYYLMNNYNPGYFGDGSNAYADKNPDNYVFTVPPTSVRSIGDELNDHKIGWAYYGDQYNIYLTDKYQLKWNNGDEYCNICNWAQYSTSIMTDAGQRAAHIKDTTDLYAAIKSGDLPAVSYVKPSGLVDGHPASSKLNLFEGFTKKIVNMVKANPKLWDDTAILVTFDEGGGYWDSGYVQPVDFFGDGTRVPMIIVSKYSTGGHINHSYTDHASVVKFIEANWDLPPITSRSRDNLPNPRTEENPYVPVNSPAIGDMMDMFQFARHDGHGEDHDRFGGYGYGYGKN